MSRKNCFCFPNEFGFYVGKYEKFWSFPLLFYMYLGLFLNFNEIYGIIYKNEFSILRQLLILLVPIQLQIIISSFKA